MLTVACVLWVGEFQERNYSAKWVHRLRSMVARNLRQEHRFVCLSNIEVEGVETIPLARNWPGWWAKIELFSHAFERALYLDLDTVITGSLDEIADYPADFTLMPHDFVAGKEAKQRLGFLRRYQSSCMVWSGLAGREVFGRFNAGVMEALHGDQDWIGIIKPDLPTLPPEWFDKMRYCPSGPAPGVKVVISHPRNDTAAKQYPWVKKVWR